MQMYPPIVYTKNSEIIFTTLYYFNKHVVSKACYFQHVSAKCMRKSIFMFIQGVGIFEISILKSWKSKKI